MARTICQDCVDGVCLVHTELERGLSMQALARTMPQRKKDKHGSRASQPQAAVQTAA